MNSFDKRLIQTIFIKPPSLQDNTADADRLVNALKKRLEAERVELAYSLLKCLPGLLRKSAGRLKCVLINELNRWRLIHLAAADDSTPIAGLAVDLGTTRVSMRLLNLESGNVLTEAAFINPQTAVGPDILSRIHYAEKKDGLAELNEMIITCFNNEIRSLCASAALQPDQILILSIAGNTSMTHLFLGLSPHGIIREPYIPVSNRPGWIAAPEVGIEINPRASIFVFPNVGSYFGGDMIAGILFSGMHQDKDVSMLVDVGTNAEVVLGNKDWMIACAGAAGPALEGGVSRMGMLAGPGVIDRIAVDPATGNFIAHTIGDLPPKGICGSGLIELAAELFLNGMIDNRGKFVPSACSERLIEVSGVSILVVIPGSDSANGSDLLITQIDLDSLFRSKAAMYTILETITTQVEVSFDDLKCFYVAGTFGTFIRPEAAITIGMLPDIPISRFHPLGNSSLGGATQVLQNADAVIEIDRIRDRITYLELNVNQNFMNRFSAAKFLPHTDRSRFPSVKP